MENGLCVQYENAGDQYLGQVLVSGLDINFELLKDLMVGGHSIAHEIFHLLYYCPASLCCHFDFMVRILPM